VSTWHRSRHYPPCLPSASAFVQTQQAAAARTELLRRCFGTECAAFEQESRACVTCGRDTAGTLKNALLQNRLPDCAGVDGLTLTKRIDELRRKGETRDQAKNEGRQKLQAEYLFELCAALNSEMGNCAILKTVSMEILMLPRQKATCCLTLRFT